MSDYIRIIIVIIIITIKKEKIPNSYRHTKKHIESLACDTSQRLCATGAVHEIERNTAIDHKIFKLTRNDENIQLRRSMSHPSDRDAYEK